MRQRLAGGEIRLTACSYDGLEQVPQAHDDMEHDRATGKLVVRVRH